MLAFIEETGTEVGGLAAIVLLILGIFSICFAVGIYRWLFPKEDQKEKNSKVCDMVPGLVILSVIAGCIWTAAIGWIVLGIGLLCIWLIKYVERSQKKYEEQ